MSGVKAYTYGGIMINQEKLNGRDYEKTRSEIITLMQEKCVLPDGTSLIEFIMPREELYSGPFITNYPDILLEFKYGYGVGWAVNVPLMTQADSHNIQPGSHRGATGTFLMRSSQQVNTNIVDLHDITPSVLELMGVAASYDYDGKSIFNPNKK
jgi:predicted AlkP superfamily phosphohydrolase/phosphomutase